MSAPTTYANPYWDAVSDRVREDRWLSYQSTGLVVGGLDHMNEWVDRTDLVGQYAWTITSPEAVAFVAEHIGQSAIDPLAGSGYWAFLLAQHGIDVAASDIAPPDVTKNGYHKAGVTHVTVAQADAVDAVTVLGEGRTLLLAWPPYSEPIGAQVLAAHQGERFVFIGEGEWGCCGGEDMWDVIRDGWHSVAEHRPVQWWGMHDYITVYERGAES